MDNQREVNFLKGEVQRLKIELKKKNITIKKLKEKLSKTNLDHVEEKQEQSLLWTLYSILDGLAIEGEAREKAINEFKEHLKYYKDE